MRIGIISLGGRSSKAIATACEEFFSKVDMLDIRHFEVHLNNKGVMVTYDKKDLEKYDCLYVRGSYRYALLQRSITRALHHDVYMPIQPDAFTIGHDKFLTLVELQRQNVTIPKTYYAATTKLAKRILENEVKYPVIMKVPEGTHGKGVMVADSVQSARTVLDVLESMKQAYLIQEFIKTKNMTDIRAVVCGNKVIAAYRRQAAKGEMRTNVHSGGTRKKHELSDVEKELAITSAKAIGADICGVDIFNARKPSVNEINLSPGIEAAQEITNKNIARLIAKYLYGKTVAFSRSTVKKGDRKVRRRKMSVGSGK